MRCIALEIVRGEQWNQSLNEGTSHRKIQVIKWARIIITTVAAGITRNSVYRTIIQINSSKVISKVVHLLIRLGVDNTINRTKIRGHHQDIRGALLIIPNSLIVMVITLKAKIIDNNVLMGTISELKTGTARVIAMLDHHRNKGMISEPTIRAEAAAARKLTQTSWII